MVDLFSPTFPMRPFREQAQRERDVQLQAALGQLRGLRAPQVAPTGAGFRGVDLGRLGAASAQRAAQPANLAQQAELMRQLRERQLLAAESLRRSRMRARAMDATAQALREGSRLGSAWAGRSFADLLSRTGE